MAAADNPYFIQPANPLAALMQGVQGFDAARKRTTEDEMKAGRLEAMQTLQGGGDIRGPLAKLIGIGDTKGAEAIATYANNQATQQFHQQSLAQTGAHQTAQLAQQGTFQQAQMANMEEQRKLARDTFEAGKVQILPGDALGGAPQLVRVGPDKATVLPTVQSGTPAPPNQNITSGQVTGVDYGPIATNGSPAPNAPAPSGARLSATDLMQKYGGKPNDGKDWAYLASLPEKAQENIYRLTTHDINPSSFPARTMQGMGESARSAYVTAAAKFDKTYNQQDYPIIQQSRQQFASGPLGNNVRSLNVVVDHAATLGELGAALQNGNVQLFNSIAQHWAQQTGNPAPTNFDMAKTIVGTELIKALGVQGAGSEGERAELGNKLSRASSPEQIVGIINSVVRPLLGGQLRGLRQQFVSSTRQSEAKFNEMLFPTTRNFLEAKGQSQPDTQQPESGGVKWRLIK